MATNLYHLLSFIPRVEAWEMPPALEAMAEALVRSGKLRINADTERNYVRLGTSDSDKTFTARELNDPALRATTYRALARHVAPAEGQSGLARLYDQLQNELKKGRGVPPDKEIKIARVLVQSAEPAVIQCLLESGTEVFVSYSHTVGDLMAVHHWDSFGSTSGMQSTEAGSTAVYVSAGGDPFFEGEHKTYTTDGFPALARMVVIAGQELGHFADLRRTRQGITGRHSTDPNHVALRAAAIAREGRIEGQQRLASLARRYAAAGLPALRRAEKGIAFYHARFRYTPPWCLYQLRRAIAWTVFRHRCRKSAIYLPLAPYPYLRHGDAIEQFLSDMEYNLAPDADVYRNPDPLVEEAIAVIEAVARVPQQVHKWGHAAVSLAWPSLYRFYFGTIIPATSAAIAQPPQPINMTIYQSLAAKIRRRLRPRPGYYPE